MGSFSSSLIYCFFYYISHKLDCLNMLNNLTITLVLFFLRSSSFFFGRCKQLLCRLFSWQQYEERWRHALVFDSPLLKLKHLWRLPEQRCCGMQEISLGKIRACLKKRGCALQWKGWKDKVPLHFWRGVHLDEFLCLFHSSYMIRIVERSKTGFFSHSCTQSSPKLYPQKHYSSHMVKTAIYVQCFCSGAQECSFYGKFYYFIFS